MAASMPSSMPQFVIFIIKFIHITSRNIFIQAFLYCYYKIALYVSCERDKKALHTRFTMVLTPMLFSSTAVYESHDAT